MANKPKKPVDPVARTFELIAEADQASERDRFDLAASKLKRARNLQPVPGHPELEGWISKAEGELAYDAEKFDDAYMHLSDAASIFHDTDQLSSWEDAAESRNNGLKLLEENNQRWASRAYLEVAERAGTHGRVDEAVLHYQKGLALFQGEDHDDELLDLIDSLTKAQAHFALGKLLTQLGEFDQAEASLRRVVKLDQLNMFGDFAEELKEAFQELAEARKS
ncbi:MAG: tetratricopeptide repeat protein [Micrococcales bacterium]|nr:tetratricopeptide repeat protein [Micrococcales bacterium]